LSALSRVRGRRRAAAARPGASRRLGSWSGLGRCAGAASSATTRTPSGCAPPTGSAGSHRTPGLCRRSPPAGDRWHRPQPVPAARFTAVLPRGSRGDTGGARRHRQGDGDTAEGSVVGGPETSGGSPGTGGPVWPLEVPVRGAVAHRLRPVGISAQARSVTAGAGLAFPVPARSSAGPPPTSTRRAPCSRQGQARCAHPFGTLDGGRSGALGVVEGQGELRAGQPGCARSLCRDVFWRGQALLDEPGLQAGDGAVLQGQLAAVARDLLGWPVIQR
jgi:hypothetical protein